VIVSLDKSDNAMKDDSINMPSRQYLHTGKNDEELRGMETEQSKKPVSFDLTFRNWKNCKKKTCP
jgi:hypothetical protein